VPATHLIHICQHPAPNAVHAKTQRLLVKPPLWILCIKIYYHVAFQSHLSPFNALDRDLIPCPHPCPLSENPGSNLLLGINHGAGEFASKEGFPCILLSAAHTAQRPHSRVSSKATSRQSTLAWGRGCAFPIAETQQRLLTQLLSSVVPQNNCSMNRRHLVTQ